MSQRRFHSDWNCSHCNFRNFGSRANCKNCSHGKRPSNNNNNNILHGDWNCSKCNFLNFKSRTHCKNCNLSKTNVSTSPSTSSIKTDWNCIHCNFLNFKSRNVCKNCGKHKPNKHTQTTINKPGKKVDWNCSKCNYMNFASRSKCNKCGTIKQLKTESNAYDNEKTESNTGEKDVVYSHKDTSDDIKEKTEPEPEPEYKIMRKKQFNFTEITKATKINIAVGKIATAIVGSIGAYASGGALLPVLATQIKNAVVHVNWSTSNKNERIVDHFFIDNCYLFLMIERDIKEKNKKIIFAKRKQCEIIVNTKFLYIECGNDIAKKELQLRAREQAQDALKWIDDNNAGSW